MLVNNFTNTYGLYPQFLVPVMKIFGLSIFHFTLIMSFLLVLCFIFIFYILLKTVENKILILFGFTTIFYNSFVYNKITTDYDSLFAMSPIRWIIVLSLIIYLTFYLKIYHKNNNDKILIYIYYGSFIIFSTGILWNPEFGLLTYLTLVVFYFTLNMSNRNPKTGFKKLILVNIKLFLAGIGLMFFTFLAYMLVIKFSYGHYPDLFKMADAIKTIYISGLNMLPMPTSFPSWILIVLIYIIGLLYSFYHLINKQKDSTILKDNNLVDESQIVSF